MSASDLDSRIAGALQRKAALPDDIAALLAEVEAALTKTGDELSRARSEAFDPLSTTAAVASARGVTFDAEFRHGRLVVARDALGTKHQEAVARVEQERRAAAHADLIARRDEFAARFEGVWRDHAEVLASFLHEVATIDEASPPPIGCGWAPGSTAPRASLVRAFRISISTSWSAWRRGCRRGTTTRTGRRADVAAAAAEAQRRGDGTGAAAAARRGHFR